MARTRIEDLPKDVKISKGEMKRVLGGIGTWPTPEKPSGFLRFPKPTEGLNPKESDGLVPKETGGLVPKETGGLSIETVPLPE